MLNKKGFTLVELLAMMVILGILMAVTIPNIVGIAEANKKQAYAEDAKKFKNTVEYLLRSDEDYIKPENTGDCVVVSLTHLVANKSGDVSLDGTEYETSPNASNGGKYLVDYSYVVMKKNSSSEYVYYVQLIEDLDGAGTGTASMGIGLTKYNELENSGYLDKINEFTSAPGNVFNNYSNARSGLSGICSVRGIYYSNSFIDS